MDVTICRWLVAAVTGAAALACAPAAGALSLTDAAVFSSNAEGGAYGGLIWNTAGNPPDTANRWNLYFSSNPDIADPVWLNGFNDSQTNLDIALAPGEYSFVLYAESAGNHDDHFTLSLYFGGDQASPGISAAVPVNSGAFGVASGNNGLGLLECFGACNYVPNAGSLSFGDGALVATLTGFSWFTDAAGAPDFVWPHHHGEGYGGSGNNDFFGIVTLRVEAVSVPEPASVTLLGGSLLGLAALRRKRRI
jgi:hypothetical protein